MKVRCPPGRAGRPWLEHRLEVARRGAELLDDKLRGLLRERARVAPEAKAARMRWEQLAQEADLWSTRAAVLSADPRAEPISPGARADAIVRWHQVLGVPCPAAVEVRLSSSAAPGGASAAMIQSIQAHRTAVEAAARAAVLQRALELLDAAIHATALRRNAIEHRWIPAHEEALLTLTSTLDELEREDGTRARLIIEVQRGDERGDGAAT